MLGPVMANGQCFMFYVALVLYLNRRPSLPIVHPATPYHSTCHQLQFMDKAYKGAQPCRNEAMA